MGHMSCASVIKFVLIRAITNNFGKNAGKVFTSTSFHGSRLVAVP